MDRLGCLPHRLTRQRHEVVCLRAAVNITGHLKHNVENQIQTLCEELTAHFKLNFIIFSFVKTHVV